jgi:hypothetical protein
MQWEVGASKILYGGTTALPAAAAAAWHAAYPKTDAGGDSGSSRKGSNSISGQNLFGLKALNPSFGVLSTSKGSAHVIGAELLRGM